MYKIKNNQDSTINKFKVRLVAHANEQEKDVNSDEVFTPYARYEIIRILLADIIETKINVHHVNVVSAYVQGELTDNTYNATTPNVRRT